MPIIRIVYCIVQIWIETSDTNISNIEVSDSFFIYIRTCMHSTYILCSLYGTSNILKPFSHISMIISPGRKLSQIDQDLSLRWPCRSFQFIFETTAAPQITAPRDISLLRAWHINTEWGTPKGWQFVMVSQVDGFAQLRGKKNKQSHLDWWPNFTKAWDGQSAIALSERQLRNIYTWQLGKVWPLKYFNQVSGGHALRLSEESPLSIVHELKQTQEGVHLAIRQGRQGVGVIHHPNWGRTFGELRNVFSFGTANKTDKPTFDPFFYSIFQHKSHWISTSIQLFSSKL